MNELKALVAKIGTYDKAAKKLRLKKPTLHAWATGRRKISLRRIAEVEKKTGIPRTKLRPDIWPDEDAA